MVAEVLTIVASPSITALGIMVLALLVAAWVPGRLRRLGFQPERRDSELDWAGIIGLSLGVLGVLLGLSGLASGAGLTALGKLLGALFRTLLSLAPALAILAGGGHAVAARRRAALSRQEEAVAREEEPWIRRGSMLIAALTLVEMSLSLPAIVIIVGAIALWLYRNPAMRARMESSWLELKAGQQLRTSALSAGDTLDDLRLVGPVGLLDTRIEGLDQPMANTALLQKLKR